MAANITGMTIRQKDHVIEMATFALNRVQMVLYLNFSMLVASQSAVSKNIAAM